MKMAFMSGFFIIQLLWHMQMENKSQGVWTADRTIKYMPMG